MKTIERLTLLNDSFTNDEAKDILLHLFNSPINFYNIKNWSKQERYRKDDEVSQGRIPALRKEIEKLQDILTQSKNTNKKIKVNTEICIYLEDE